MGRPKIGDQVIVDLLSDERTLSGMGIEGPWISTGKVQGKPTWKVGHGGGFSNWHLEERIMPDPEASERI